MSAWCAALVAACMAAWPGPASRRPPAPCSLHTCSWPAANAAATAASCSAGHASNGVDG